MNEPVTGLTQTHTHKHTHTHTHTHVSGRYVQGDGHLAPACFAALATCREILCKCGCAAACAVCELLTHNVHLYIDSLVECLCELCILAKLVQHTRHGVYPVVTLHCWLHLVLPNATLRLRTGKVYQPMSLLSWRAPRCGSSPGRTALCSLLFNLPCWRPRLAPGR